MKMLRAITFSGVKYLRRNVRFFSSQPLDVLFFGTDETALETLKVLHSHKTISQPLQPLINRLEVVCPPDKKKGRGLRKQPNAVKIFCLQHDLPYHHTPDTGKSLKDWKLPVSNERFDVGVVVSFGYFIQPHMLQPLKYGAINMHPSLLPKYRGPAPVHHALLNGDDKTGISIIEIDPKAFDVGRILLQKEFQIPCGIQLNRLSSQLAQFGASCVIESLQNLNDLKLKGVEQDDRVATKAPKVKPTSGVISWMENAGTLFQKWQALGDSIGISAIFNSKQVELVYMEQPNSKSLLNVQAIAPTASPGSLIYDKREKAIWIKCTDDWLLVKQLKVESRKVGDAVDFANGYRLKQHTVYRFDKKIL